MPRGRNTGLGLLSALVAVWFFAAASPLRAADIAPVPAADGRLELALCYRSLGYRDLREPKSFTPSAVFIPDRGGWTRNWTEQRAYASLA